MAGGGSRVAGGGSRVTECRAPARQQSNWQKVLWASLIHSHAERWRWLGAACWARSWQDAQGWRTRWSLGAGRKAQGLNSSSVLFWRTCSHEKYREGLVTAVLGVLSIGKAVGGSNLLGTKGCQEGGVPVFNWKNSVLVLSCSHSEDQEKVPS